MHPTVNSTSSISKLMNLHPVICSPSKQSLWRQLQSNENKKQEPIRKNSCNLQQQQQQITPIGRKKQKSTTISNFLKHLQVQVEQKDQRLQTQSEIVSIMDIRYNDSFYSRSLSHKKYQNGKSFLADSKFQLILTIASVKEFFTSFKAYVETIVTNYQSDLENFARNTKKLLSQYESTLSEKALHIKTVELQLREQQLQHIHEIHILKSHLQTATSNLQSLQQKYTTIEQTLKSQKMNYEQIKCHNRQLSELLLKYHHKTEALEIKIEEIKKEAEQKMVRETKKLEEKYERLYQEQMENCELKIQNNRMLWQNFVGNAGWSKASSSAVEISKIEDIGSVQLCQSFTGSKIEEEGSNQQSSIRIEPQTEKKTLTRPERSKFGAQIERIKMIQTNCSPKSNCSFRRFARTSNSGPQYQFSGKIQKSDSGLKPFLTQTQTTLAPKFVPQKYNRLSQNSDKPQSALQKQNPSKLQNQQNEGQIERKKNNLNTKKTPFENQNLQIFHYNLPNYIQKSSIKQEMKKYDGGISIQISRVINQDNRDRLLTEEINDFKNPINAKLNIRQNPINDREKRKNRQRQKDLNGMDIGSQQVKNLGSCYNLGSTLSTFNSVNIEQSRVSSCDRIIQKKEQKLENYQKKIVLIKNGNTNYNESGEGKDNIMIASTGTKNIAYVDRKLRQTIA